MNTKLKDLTGQALDITIPETWSLFDYEKLERYTEKLSELIVEECCKEILKWKEEPFPFDEETAVEIIRNIWKK